MRRFSFEMIYYVGQIYQLSNIKVEVYSLAHHIFVTEDYGFGSIKISLAVTVSLIDSSTATMADVLTYTAAGHQKTLDLQLPRAV